MKKMNMKRTMRRRRAFLLYVAEELVDVDELDGLDLHRHVVAAVGNELVVG